MRNLNFIKKTWFLVVFLILGVFAVHIIQTAYAEPEENEKTSNETILVTQDYVDEKIKQLADANELKVKELEELVEKMKKQMEDMEKELVEVEKYGKFIPLELEEGQTLIVGESGEIILRGGKAKAIAGEAGGLSDVTAGSGVDITTGQDVPLNHLLLISRDDGRGLKVVSSKAWVLVKGPYTIEE
ncbi:hypothetical protein [Acetivibrio saccincola]|jgi:ribonucleotide reductase alpha subunit|uniref:Uncharacterized protein n=1 Tax=Acetivibrio saccincola TaxID=1677857 RepID=A0A2K9EHL4_9FIRM|nr:hypothetical protein [Acetivibrio saccincola]AUG58705.1 hypothetical protein HVS_14220 [Acetivibrio saccincola]NLW25982.1 hypothetical protein [Acetivibrio saccincola]PQQ66193.1 hypothetical protein B9R14_05115 [Acetivibrio saccincola]HOA97996.1 hypothetical protein [Acetivibrio saccincola]HQD28644.1 hypothetical protein [Acetivibrio saccincola]